MTMLDRISAALLVIVAVAAIAVPAYYSSQQIPNAKAHQQVQQ